VTAKITIPIDESTWLRLEAFEKIDAISDSFESAWKNGNSPKVADYAVLIDKVDRADLLRELMIVAKQCDTRDKTKSRAAQDLATLSLKSGKSETDIEFLESTEDPANLDLELELPIDFGDFILLELLGRGSFGHVYRAENTRTRNQVAIKIPHASLFSSSDEYRLFVREARNVARLSHPGVVKIYDVDYVDKIPFLIMEYVEGKNLKEYLSTFAAFTPRAAAQLVVELARTVDHAHQNGVVHRDIKPSNILIETSASSVANNTSPPAVRPRLLDFGIAKLSGSNTIVTQQGMVLGTPAYMSPEQARGNSNLSTNQSDIYSLGVILYELLTGTTPFRGETANILAQVPNEEVPSIFQRFRGIPRNLAIICHQALRLEPKDRYATAADFANDLERWLNDEPILGKPISVAEWAIKKARKNRIGVFASVVVSFVLATTGAAVWSFQKSQKERMTTFLEFNSKNELAANAAGRLQDWIGKLPLSLTDQKSFLGGIADAEPAQLLRIGNSLRKHSSAAIPFLSNAFISCDGNDALRFRVGCVCGVVDPIGFEDLGISKSLTKWLVDSSCFGDVDGWIELTSVFHQSLTKPLTEQFSMCGSNIQRTTIRPLLVGLLKKSSSATTVDAMLPCDANELWEWKILLDRDLSESLRAIKEKRHSIETEFGMDQHGEAQAKAYANLLLMEYGLGAGDRVWPSLAIAPDPRLRTYFIHQIALTGFDLNTLVGRLSEESDASIQYALLAAISQCPKRSLGEPNVEKIEAWLLDAYQSHPDCGVHGMCRWLLNAWGQAESLRQMDSQLSRQGIVEGRNWYVNRLGMQMLLVKEPVEFTMETFASKPSKPSMIKHGIPWGFAIGLDEVTLGQYRQFDPTFLAPDEKYFGLADQENDNAYPVTGISMVDALKFSRWLSSEQGFSEEQMSICNLVEDETVEVDYRKEGYRLPTRGEWEYGCLATTKTDCSYGTVHTPWQQDYAFNGEVRTATTPVGTRLPNTFGTFDGMANASEFVSTKFEQSGKYPSDELGSVKLSLREGCCACGYKLSRPSSTFTKLMPVIPRKPNNSTGFRIAKTLAVLDSAYLLND